MKASIKELSNQGISNQEALCVRELSKVFDGFTLQNISFSIPKGSIMGLIGQNGSGKTTTIKLILNLLKSQSGTITVLGMDNIKDEREVKEKIGVVFDSQFFVDEWKMSDVEKAMGMFYKNWESNAFYKYLDTFHISRKKCVKELSKGMQMKLMLACSFSHQAELLILDEPTSGLDPVSRDELLDILEQYTKDKKHSVLFSTHITSDLDKIADSITFINQGKLLYTGKKDRFVEKYRVISGEKEQLTAKLKQCVISSKYTADKFEGLITVEHLSAAPNLTYRPATMDEIIVFINKGGQQV